VKGIGRKADIVMRATLHQAAPEHLLRAMAPAIQAAKAPLKSGQCPQ
jgi:hypothetical protein